MSNFAFKIPAWSLFLIVMGDMPLVPCEDQISEGLLLSLLSRCLIQRMCSYALFESSRDYRNLMPPWASPPKSTVSENIQKITFFQNCIWQAPGQQFHQFTANQKHEHIQNCCATGVGIVIRCPLRDLLYFCLRFCSVARFHAVAAVASTRIMLPETPCLLHDKILS